MNVDTVAKSNSWKEPVTGLVEPNNSFQELRQKASEILADKRVDLSRFSRDDLAYLVEEIQVHQVELEIQNQELLATQLNLSSEKERFKKLYNFAPTGYCSIDSNQEIQNCNYTFAKMVGRPRNAIIGSKVSDYVVPASQDDYYLFHRKVIGQNAFIPIHVKLTCDLSSSQIDVHLSAMPYNEVEMSSDISSSELIEDRDVAYLLAITDVTELKVTEHDLATRLDQQGVVADLGQAALSTTDLTIFATHVAQTIRKLLECDFCTILKQESNSHDLNVIAGDGWPSLFASVEVRTQSTYTLNLDNSTIIDEFSADERIRAIENRISGHPFSGACVVIKINNRQWGTLSVHNRNIKSFDEGDIRFLESLANLLSIAIERRQMEDVLHETQKFKSLGLLAGGVAHDFNNLLTSLLIQNGLALRELDQAHPSYQRLKRMETSAGQAAHLTRQLLAYAGKGQFQTLTFNLNDLVNEYSDLLQATIPSCVKLIIELDETLPNILSDKGQVQQILMNLIINAAEAYEDSTGEIIVNTRYLTQIPTSNFTYLSKQLDQNKTYVHLSITDKGKGIEKENIEQVFDPFFTTKFTGRGLGLAAVLGIAHQIDGAIAINSMIDQGTTFHIFLPTTDEIRQIEAKTPKPASNSAEIKRTILHVDDDCNLREGISEYLQMFGYDVIEAEDGEVGLRLFEENQERIDLILLDLTMPNMSGDEAFLAIRALMPTIPIIIMSGYGKQEAIQKLDSHIYKFVHKPFETDSLIQTIEYEINHQILPVPVL